MNTPQSAWLSPAPGRPGATPAPHGPWWRHTIDLLRAPVWPAIVAALSLLALLIGFHRVLLEAVQQGDLRRQATAAKVDGLWRCNSMPQRGERETCLKRVHAMPALGVATALPTTASVD
jgi:hypothetical protein